MIVELTKNYYLNGVLKPKGTIWEVDKQFAEHLASGGYLDPVESGLKPRAREVVKRKQIKLENTKV
jgi:hypothetical protein